MILFFQTTHKEKNRENQRNLIRINLIRINLIPHRPNTQKPETIETRERKSINKQTQTYSKLTMDFSTLPKMDYSTPKEELLKQNLMLLSKLQTNGLAKEADIQKAQRENEKLKAENEKLKTMEGIKYLTDEIEKLKKDKGWWRKKLIELLGWDEENGAEWNSPYNFDIKARDIIGELEDRLNVNPLPPNTRLDPETGEIVPILKGDEVLEDDIEKLKEENEELKTSLQTTTSYWTDKYEADKVKIRQLTELKDSCETDSTYWEKEYHELKLKVDWGSIEDYSSRIDELIIKNNKLYAENKELKEKFECVEQSTESSAYAELEIERLQAENKQLKVKVCWLEDGVSYKEKYKKELKEAEAKLAELKKQVSSIAEEYLSTGDETLDEIREYIEAKTDEVVELKELCDENDIEY